MKLISIFVSLFIASTASADPFAGLEQGQSACYDRGYSRAHMDSHPAQTIRDIEVIITRYMWDDGYESKLAEVEVVRDSDGKRFYAVLGCGSDGVCAIDCDGGSMKLSIEGNEMTMVNHGFMLEGGCGEEGETMSLDPTPGGDDIFKMTKKADNRCLTGLEGWVQQ